MSDPREPDTEQIAAFVRALFVYADDGSYVSLRAFDQFDGGVAPPYIRGVQVNGHGLDPVIEAAVSGARFSANAAAPLVFCPPIATFRTAQRAAEDDLVNGVSISVELDAGNTANARQRLEGLLGPATVVVASGGEWIDPDTGEVFPKLHLHWRLSEPTRTPEEHARLKHARRLACALVSADPTAKTSVHPLRWPGSWHLKAAPKLARIVTLNEAAEAHLPEAIDALEGAAEVEGLNGLRNSRQAASGPAQAPLALVKSALLALPNADEHWDAWIKIGLLVYAATGASDDGLSAWIEWSRKSSKFVSGACDERWSHFHTSPPTRGGAGTLFMLAKAAGWQRPNQEPRDKASTHAEATEASPALFNPWASLQPPAFPFDAVPDVLRTFIEERAAVIGADPCAIFWASLGACSAALDGRIRLQMKKRDSWSVPPFLWVALVGAPSTKKTPVFDAAWAPLHVAQNHDIQHWKQEYALWSALPKKERAETPEPVCRRRLASHDATVEAIQEILGRQDRGLGLFRDELAGWIGSLEKYAGPRGGAADRAFYLQAYNGGDYVADRIARGTVPINNLGLSIAGGIQPDRLRQLGDLTADGLWQRFLPFIVAPASLGCDATDTAAISDYTAVVERLLRVEPQTRVQLSEGAHTIREDVAKRLFELEQSEALGPAFSAFCGKLQGVWGRICLVLSQIDPASVPFIVPERIADMARVLIFRSVLPNAAKIYASMGGAGGNIDATRSIGGYILTKQKQRVLASDLTNNVRACRNQSLEDVQRLVSPLVAGGWLTPEKEYSPNSWIVHPYVHQQFAAQAAQEVERRATIRALITGTQDQDKP